MNCRDHLIIGTGEHHSEASCGRTYSRLTTDLRCAINHRIEQDLRDAYDKGTIGGVTEMPNRTPIVSLLGLLIMLSGLREPSGSFVRLRASAG
jgi:hypothetical protein